MLISSKGINALLIGATLSVAPIFSPVWAQGTSEQGNLLREMQAMQLEIAELRDMIERQQFQLRQLQRAQQAGTQAPPRSSAPSASFEPRANAPQTFPQTGAAPAAGSQQTFPVQASGSSSGLPAGTPVASQTGSAAPSVSASTPPGNLSQPPMVTQQGLPAAQANSTIVDDEPAPVLANQERDFYRPLDPQSDGVIVEERAINAPSAGTSNMENAAQPNTVPVIDRSIGAPASAANVPASTTLPGQNQTVVAVQPGVAAQPGVAVQQGALPTQPGQAAVQPNARSVAQPASQVPQQAPATGGGVGVIAVPTAATGGAVVSGAPAGAAQTQSFPARTQSFPAPVNQPVARASQPAPSAPVTLAEQDYYQQGFELLKQSQHSRAVDVFKRQIDTYPQGEFADDAYYWIAESMYVNRELEQSKLYFKSIIDSFAQSPRLPDAMLKTAYIEQEQGNQIEARILLQEIMQYHPRSNAAISAKNRLAEMDN